jgi:hypothetical protein
LVDQTVNDEISNKNSELLNAVNELETLKRVIEQERTNHGLKITESNDAAAEKEQSLTLHANSLAARIKKLESEIEAGEKAQKLQCATYESDKQEFMTLIALHELSQKKTLANHLSEVKGFQAVIDELKGDLEFCQKEKSIMDSLNKQLEDDIKQYHCKAERYPAYNEVLKKLIMSKSGLLRPILST